MPQPRSVSTCSRRFSSTLAMTRSASRSRITSSFGFFSPPTRVLVATPSGGWVQYTVQPATASPAPTAKSITLMPRPGHPPPNLVRIDTPEGPGLVNCNGFHNPGLAAYRAALAHLPHRVPLIVSATGESAEDIVAVAEGLAPFGDLVE